jgi:predicted amidophosphoribosyltransferase
MSSATPPRALSHQESPARAFSQKESPARALSQWLQLMLAEIAAKRDAAERARTEEERRRAEDDAEGRGDSAGEATRS